MQWNWNFSLKEHAEIKTRKKSRRPKIKVT